MKPILARWYIDDDPKDPQNIVVLKFDVVNGLEFKLVITKDKLISWDVAPVYYYGFAESEAEIKHWLDG